MGMNWRVFALSIYLLWIKDSYAQDSKRIRIYLNEDERLLVPKNSKVSILRPVVVNYHDKINYNPLIPVFIPPKRTIETYNTNALSDFYHLENALATPPYHVQAANAIRNSIGAGGGEWPSAASAAVVAAASASGVKGPAPDVKPVHEHIEGDIKYDFRTKTHSIRR